MKKINWLLEVKKVALLMIGLTIAHLGVTFFIQADMGADPYNVLVQGVFRTVPWPESIGWTHGMTHILICLLIVLVLLVVDRSYIGIGTLLCMVFGGPIIDMFTWLLSPVINNGLPLALRIVVLGAGCVILAVGMSFVIKSEAGTGPNDLVALVIAEKWKKKFGVVRVITDFLFVALGFLLGGKFGLGTIICAFLVGVVAQCFLPYAGKICKKVLYGH